MTEKKILQTDYSQFLQEILTKIQSARYDMLQSVSRQTVLLYWEIGKAVSEKMREKGWGAYVVKQLSKDLQTQFPDVRGFSVRNIWRMRAFYEYYSSALQITNSQENRICATAVAQIQNTENSAAVAALNSAVKTQIVENSATAVALNSATTAAEFQNYLFQLITAEVENFAKPLFGMAKRRKLPNVMCHWV